MNVIILAAGFFPELHPMSLTRPGSLMNVAGRPLLEWFLANTLPDSGIHSVCIVTNELYAHPFKSWAKQCPLFLERGITIEIQSNGVRTPDECRGALYDLRDGMAGLQDGEVLVLGGDNLVFKPLAGFLEWSRKRSAPSVVISEASSIERTRELSSAAMDATGRLTYFEEKPLEPQSTQCGALVYYFPQGMNKTLDQYLSQGGNPDRPGRFIEWLVKNFSSAYGWRFDGLWFDVANPNTLEEAHRILTKSNDPAGSSHHRL